MRFLVKQLKSTKAAAELLGISRRTVERYVKNQIQHPKPALAARLEAEVRKRWQPLVRKRARDQAARQTGLVIETRARFGFTAAPGTTDDGRMRRLTQHLPPEYAARLFAAQESGATEPQLRAIAAEGLQEIYFKDNGARATGLLVEFTDIDYVDFTF
ncbi:XRE family transcriptional regulator [Streptomyces bambusae]|uniref:XRE family transcriptional regulator n=2 Tax=Streptomyces bambusae TaxID=1550616 RepID=A0ABS6ZFI1_9ACTN|nr:XRE family transcriptional regulator [Streptomyces bambusae]